MDRRLTCRHGPGQHAARSSGAAFVETKASPEARKAIKRKDDARISLQESVNALFKDFEAADTDSDGLLTVEEIEVYGKRTW